MLDLSQYPSLGAALRDALEQWADETCLIEADRDREKCRLTYREFTRTTGSLARTFQDLGFSEGHRAAIIMTNQSKWLISAYTIFYCGGVLVPLDYKLPPPEHLQLLIHSRARFLLIEYHLWRAIMQTPGFQNWDVPTVFVTEAPEKADVGPARRWETSLSTGGDDDPPSFVPRARGDWATIVYSSGTGGRPKGCVLTHANYLEQCQALIALYPFWPGVRYLSILPTNHAIDFMVGFIGPFVCGATVVHLRTLRPEFIRDAFTKYRITYMALVPMVLKNLERGLREKFAALPSLKRLVLHILIAINKKLTRHAPNLKWSRRLLRQVHDAFGGNLRALFVGGAFTEPATLQFFYDLGIPVANGYGLTEAGTAITLNDLRPFRPDTVGRPLPGVELQISSADVDGVGEVIVRSKMIMSHYLDDPDLTEETIVDGWLHTGDLGRLDETGHLQLSGRKKNMIVTEGGKNIYPEDIENQFEGLAVKELCIFAANYLWPQRSVRGEQLALVLHLEPGQSLTETLLEEIAGRNRRLPDFKRIGGYLLWEEDFPRTASLKVKRNVLAEQIRDRKSKETGWKPL